MKSWKTTVMGIAAILIALCTAAKAYLDGDPATEVNLELVISEIVAGIGFIVARDNDKSSEDVGAK